MTIPAGQGCPPDSGAVIVAAYVAAGASSGVKNIGEGNPGTRRQVIASVDVQSCIGNGRAVRGRAGVTSVAAITDQCMFGVTVGLGKAVSIGRREIMAAAARNGARSPGWRDVCRHASGGNRGAVAMAVDISAHAVSAAGVGRAVVVG